MPPRLVRRVYLARAILWLERASPSLSAALAVCGLFIALSLLGFWSAVPALVRWLALMGVCVFLGWTVWRLLRDVSWPTARQGLARLEAQSALPRGLLSLLSDRPAQPDDPVAEQLWSRARDEAAKAAAQTKPSLPRVDLVSHDRWGLGPLVVLGLFLGYLVAGDEASWRVSQALSPYLTTLDDISVDVAVTPPAYTGRAPSFHTIAGGGRVSLAVLAGSKLRVEVRGTGKRLVLDPPKGKDLQLYPGVRGVSAVAVVHHGGTWQIKQGLRTIATLEIALAADKAPRVALTGAPVVTATQALRLTYRIADDFGPVRWFVQLTHDGEIREFIPPTPPMAGEGVVFMDFTPDPWAGQAVRLRLVAVDAAGNRGSSEAIGVRLPERQFSHPFAQRIMLIRRELLRQPSAKALAGQRLTEAAVDLDAYGGKFSIFAGLRAAHWRLRYDQDDPRAWSVARLLWDVALAVEGGEQGQQLTDLRSSLDQLAKRLGQANDAELADLSDRLTQALASYVAQIAVQAPPPAPGQSAAGAANVIDSATLGDLLADLRERLAAGDEAGARRMLETLRALIENLQSAGGLSAGSSTAMQQALAGLRSLEVRQQDLLGDTVAAGLRQAFGDSGQGLRALESAQQRLAEQAEVLTQQLRQAGAGTPGSLGEAQNAMNQAAKALGRGQLEAAVRAQSRAMQALAKAQSQMNPLGGGAGQGSRGMGARSVDPLGRMSGGGLGPELRLPSAKERRLIDAIRHELEQKAADPRRSPEERGYYLRLLRQF